MILRAEQRYNRAMNDSMAQPHEGFGARTPWLEPR